MNNGLNFVPSPISFDYKELYSALANDAGRMQYYRSIKDGNRTRIGKNEFVQAYNSHEILAIKPIPSKANAFQLQFYI
jgi:hypothetical protein